ncbi:MAG: ABC transporter permease [Thermomicrobiales bacterium]|nr:ABC transporter permease [Thermomicrobiales bacterium]
MSTAIEAPALGSSFEAAAIPPRRRTIAQLARTFPLAASGLIAIVLLIGAAVFAPFIAPYDPASQPGPRFGSPSREFLMGTDNLGRDVFSRVIYGARASMFVGMTAVAIALVIGGFFGIVAAYHLGYLDTAIMGIMDILFSFPPLILILAVSAALGPSLSTATLVIGLVYSPRFARIARGPALAVMQEQYVEAARVVGVSSWRIILRHLLPNVAAPLIILTSLSVSTAILTEATLSFLGLGVQPPTPSWGVMLSDARTYMIISPWVAIFPGAAIMIAVLAFNLLGDDLRDALDPRLGTL